MTAGTDPVTGETDGVQELFTHTAVEVFHSESNDVVRPRIARAVAERDGAGATFAVEATDGALDEYGGAARGPVDRVVILWQTSDDGAWNRLDSAAGDLVLDPATNTWTGSADVGTGGTLRWFSQAVDAAGNVAISTNRGQILQASAVAPTVEARPGRRGRCRHRV